ncbi:MAG: indole-3-glycerol phosphate synthase TrpC [Acidimicrobiales bacterium]|nr:indole-3-glycerol phosphate synthase TrpC [Acidimicrobiales bacterium]
MRTYLDDILAAHRAAAAADDRSFEALFEQARAAGPVRGFRAALERGGAAGLAVIAEIKRRSPSKGNLSANLDPAAVAGAYEQGGASCLSVLTDAEFFGGSVDDLVAARQACALPVLRKDFTVDGRDICDARLMGADCVLLIVAALGDDELSEFLALARSLGMDALVEIHDESELERAVAAGADLIGVNQRDLVTFAVDTDRACRLAPLLPDGVIRVAESGIQGPQDTARLVAAGYHAVLVGEALVTSADPQSAVRQLVSPFHS